MDSLENKEIENQIQYKRFSFGDLQQSQENYDKQDQLNQQKRFSFGSSQINNEHKAYNQILNDRENNEEYEDKFTTPKKICIRNTSPFFDSLQKVSKNCQGEILNIYDYYKPLKVQGQGAFGIVFQAQNLKTNTTVAIKKIKHTFMDLNDTKRIYREIKLLSLFLIQEFMKHQNIIKLIDIILPEKRIDYNDYYLIFEFMPTDLEKVINSKQQLSDDHIKYFIFQLLQGVFYMHSANLIHRDLKPNNLLLNKVCELKIADFGLARKLDEISSVTDYVVTRWYRAPEIMFSSQDYTKAIDIWSAGCILAELLGRTPIFRGQHFLDQVERIIAIMGKPKAQDLIYKIDDKTLKYLEQLPQRDPINFNLLYPNANPLALDLLQKMLVYNPNERLFQQKRFTAEECLKHPYLETLYKKCQDQNICDDTFDWDFDQIELNRHKLQEALFDEALYYADKVQL